METVKLELDPETGEMYFEDWVKLQDLKRKQGAGLPAPKGLECRHVLCKYRGDDKFCARQETTACPYQDDPPNFNTPEARYDAAREVRMLGDSNTERHEPPFKCTGTEEFPTWDAETFMANLQREHEGQVRAGKR